MTFFHVRGVRQDRKTLNTRTWFIVADSLFEALASIPAEFEVKSLEVRLPVDSGAVRVRPERGYSPARRASVGEPVRLDNLARKNRASTLRSS